MRMRVLMVLLSVLPVSAALSQTLLIADSAFSPSLDRMMRYFVLLPSGYRAGDRYPVLYLLHGEGGSGMEWSSRSGICRYAAVYRLIIVMPAAGSSWYVNARMKEGERFEDYIVDDLPRAVLSKYGIDTTHSAIAGYSMGGYGSLMLALRHPSRYRFAGSLSGAVNFTHDMESMRPNVPKASVAAAIQAFGEEPGAFYDEHDVLSLAVRSDREKTPYLYLAAGIQDQFPQFLPAHRALTDSLHAHHLAYEYHELPGRHDWAFWDREIQPMLQRLMEIVGTEKN